MPRLTCVSLFSGCGGLDLGLQRAGFRIVAAMDNDPLAIESHRANFKGTHLFEGSISDFGPKDLPKRTPAQVDLLAGGPPCPPFSKSRFYRKDKPRALEDPNGLETITGYFDVLEWLSPRAFLLENVPGLAYGVHQDALMYVEDRAEKAGYRTEWQILNAANYGVPQIRERFFMIGVRDGHIHWPTPTHAQDPSGDLFSLEQLPWVTAGEAIGDLDTDEMADDAGHFAGGKHHDLLLEIPPGDNYLFFTEERGHPEPKFKWRSRYWSFLLKLSPDRPSWTIQARRSNNMGPLHWRSRILRIEEVKRLQTFPDDWVLTGNVDAQWRQVGNAVPPRLAQAIGAELARQLKEDAK